MCQLLHLIACFPRCPPGPQAASNAVSVLQNVRGVGGAPGVLGGLVPGPMIGGDMSGIMGSHGGSWAGMGGHNMPMHMAAAGGMGDPMQWLLLAKQQQQQRAGKPDGIGPIHSGAGDDGMMQGNYDEGEVPSSKSWGIEGVAPRRADGAAIGGGGSALSGFRYGNGFQGAGTSMGMFGEAWGGAGAGGSGLETSWMGRGMEQYLPRAPGLGLGGPLPGLSQGYPGGCGVGSEEMARRGESQMLSIQEGYASGVGNARGKKIEDGTVNEKKRSKGGGGGDDGEGHKDKRSRGRSNSSS